VWDVMVACTLPKPDNVSPSAKITSRTASMIFDVAGAAAQMAVERLGNGFFCSSARGTGVFARRSKQNLPLVHEAGRAISALERKNAR